MKNNQKTKTFSQKVILPALLMGMLSSSVIMAKPACGGHDSHKEHRFENLIERLDLNEGQEKKAELILEELKEGKADNKSRKNMRHIMSLNPGDAGYLEKMTEHANQRAEQVKSKIMRMANAKQSLYEILDDSQKEKMSKMAERRMKKMEKRMRKQDEN